MAKRKISFLTAIFALITLTASIVFLPTSQAQFGPPQPNTMTSYAFIGARPNPVGVGQSVLIHFGISAPTQNATESFKGITVTITKPDNTTETLGPFITDSTGGSGTQYTPDMVGNYILQTHFPAQWYNYTGVGAFTGPIVSNTYYSASDSDKLTLVVQQEPIPQYPGVPLPTEYWTRPIDSQIREWYTIAGNWLQASGGLSGSDVPNRFVFNNDDAPETAHILWNKPLTMGGLVGGDVGIANSINQGPVGFGIGDAYEGIWSSRLILDGKLYYATYAGGLLGGFAEPVIYHCIDLHTGKELWAKTFLNNQSIAFGQELYYQGFNYMGTFSYLWVTTGGFSFFGPPSPATWYAFSADTGNWAFTIKNPPTGTTMTDPNGGIHILVVDQANGWMADWNMTNFIEASATGYYVGGGSWGNVVNGMTFDAGADTQAAKDAYSWNVTIPKNLPGSVQVAYFDDRVVGSNLGGGFGASAAPSNVAMWGISLKDGQEGRVLFNKQWASPSHWVSGNETISWATFSEQSKMGILWSKELRQHYGVSLETGDMAWGPSASQYYLDIYEGTVLTSHLVAYDKLYACGVAGIVYCYDVNNGNLLWNYTVKDPYTESMFASNWWVGITFITDGKLYIGTGEHSPNQPLPRGAPFLCLNATSGELIWRANGLFRQTGWGGLAIIGDSIMATMDTYDMQLYAVGKGPTVMTVNAPLTSSTLGSSITISGTVMDNSPGTKSDALLLRFPHGVPAVSDESQSDWMLYVYKQFAKPLNATGLPITLSVVDGNGNYRTIGTTTSDIDGFFSFNWQPDITGKYTVYASFGGSGAYYPSQAVAAFSVDSAATPAPTQASTTGPVTSSELMMYVVGATVAIIIAIAIVGLLALRKRP